MIRSRLKELAQKRRKFGYRRLHVLLRREGFKLNHKRTQRIYREENLSLRKKKRKKFASELRIPVPTPRYPNHVWSMDFIYDSLSSGRQLKTMPVLDEYTRKCYAIEVDTSLSGARVVDALNRIALTQGLPEIIIIDNGPEFIGRALDEWAYERGIYLHFITRGKPVENAYVESFNDKFRQECLNEHWFLNLEYVRQVIEEWRIDYNCQRPHSSLKDLTPDEYAAQEMKKIAAQTLQQNIESTA